MKKMREESNKFAEKLRQCSTHPSPWQINIHPLRLWIPSCMIGNLRPEWPRSTQRKSGKMPRIMVLYWTLSSLTFKGVKFKPLFSMTKLRSTTKNLKLIRSISSRMVSLRWQIKNTQVSRTITALSLIRLARSSQLWMMTLSNKLVSTLLAFSKLMS